MKLTNHTHKLPIGWQKVRLGDVAEITSGKRPPIQEKTYSPKYPYPIVGGGGISGFTSSPLCNKALITGRVGTLGKLHRLDKPCFPSDNALIITEKIKIISRNFLYWALKANIQNLVGLNRGAANPLLTQKDLGHQEIDIPKAAEQEAIARVLGSLDDKIQHNKEQNKILEETARTLFQDWFVNFGPVKEKIKAKKENRPENPYLEPEIWNLFPNTLNDDGIPEGWEEKPLSHISNLKKDKILPNKNPDKVFLHYSLPAFDSGSGANLEKGMAIKSDKFLVKEGDILLSKLNPNTPRVWFVTRNSKKIEQIASTEFLILEPTNETSSEFLYLTITYEQFKQKMEGLVTGTSKSHQRVRPNDTMQIQVLFPSNAVRVAFNSFIKPLFQQIHQNEEENRHLTELRDYLLPCLISGKVRVKV